MIKSPKRKGSKAELDLVKQGNDALPRWKFSKVPGSGAFMGHPGDIEADPDYAPKWLIEVKHYANGWGKADEQLDEHGVLRMQREGGDCLYMPLETFFAAILDAEQGRLSCMSQFSTAFVSKAKKAEADKYIAGAADAYIIRGDRKKFNVYLQASFFWGLLEAANLAGREAA